MKDIKNFILESNMLLESKLNLNNFISELKPILKEKRWTSPDNMHKKITGLKFLEASDDLDALIYGIRYELSRYLDCSMEDIEEFVENNYDDILNALEK